MPPARNPCRWIQRIGPLQSVIDICDPQRELPPFIRLQNHEELVEWYVPPINENRAEADRANSDIVAEATSPVLKREIAGGKSLAYTLTETAKRQIGACFGVRRKVIASSVLSVLLCTEEVAAVRRQEVYHEPAQSAAAVGRRLDSRELNLVLFNYLTIP